MGKRIINIGDVFEIPLSDGRKVFGQFVDQNRGQIIRVFDHFLPQNGKIDLHAINTSKLLFPPVKVGLNDPIKAGMWNIVGRLPIDNYTFPGFLHWFTEMKPPNPNEGVKVIRWGLDNGKEYIRIGATLPEKYHGLESTGVNSADLVVKRIETGFEMLNYPKKHNRFLTKEEVKKMYPNFYKKYKNIF